MVPVRCEISEFHLSLIGKSGQLIIRKAGRHSIISPLLLQLGEAVHAFVIWAKSRGRLSLSLQTGPPTKH
jgi:hypothetical protein